MKFGGKLRTCLRASSKLQREFVKLNAMFYYQLLRSTGLNYLTKLYDEEWEAEHCNYRAVAPLLHWRQFVDFSGHALQDMSSCSSVHSVYRGWFESNV